jgi:hypothetical protein
MQSSTHSRSEQDLLAHAEQQLGAPDWERVVQNLGADLETTARQTQALVRRREVKSALDLLRLNLVYSVCDWSLRLTGAWFELAGLGSLSDVAVLNRLRQSRTWLGQLIGDCLQQRHVALTCRAGVWVRLRDATVISQPGSTGTDWRVHLSLNLGTLALDGVEVTDAHGGESLARFAAQPNAIDVADRGYAFPSSLGALLGGGGRLVVRINWQNLPLIAPGQPRWKLSRWLKQCRTAQEMCVELKTPQGTFALRLVAIPLPPAEAQAARQRARQTAQKKKHRVRPETLLAAGFVLLVTNLPVAEWSLAQVAQLYRWRWQIELQIKRLKSIQHLEALRAHDADLAQTYLLGKVLAALLLERDQQALTQTVPEWLTSETRPVSVWRLMQLGWESLRQVLIGPLTRERVQECLGRLQRYLCESPRRRKQQLAAARALITHLSTC